MIFTLYFFSLSLLCCNLPTEKVDVSTGVPLMSEDVYGPAVVKGVPV